MIKVCKIYEIPTHFGKEMIVSSKEYRVTGTTLQHILLWPLVHKALSFKGRLWYWLRNN